MSNVFVCSHKNHYQLKFQGHEKKHFDIAKGIRQAEEPKYYTVQEAMEKFKITRDQLYHYTKYHQIPKIKKGKYTLISKPELDNLFEDPIIE